MNKTVLKAIEAAYKRLSAIPEKEFKMLLKKHEGGDIARALIELHEFSQSKYYKEVFKKHDKNKIKS